MLYSNDNVLWLASASRLNELYQALNLHSRSLTTVT